MNFTFQEIDEAKGYYYKEFKKSKKLKKTMKLTRLKAFDYLKLQRTGTSINDISLKIKMDRTSTSRLLSITEYRVITYIKLKELGRL